MTEIKKLLSMWGILDKETLHRFEEEGIDDTVLGDLKEEDIEKLIPRIGVRLKFKKRLAEYLRQSNSHQESSNLVDDRDDSGPIEKKIRLADNSDNTNTHLAEQIGSGDLVIPKVESIDTTAVNEEVPSYPWNAGIAQLQPPSPNLINYHEHQDYNLNEILNSTSKGKLVLSSYKQNGALNDKSRNDLADCIMSHELASDVNKRMTIERATFVAQQILQLFPEEHQIVWINAQPSKSSGMGKGKLFTKYYNMRRCMIKCGLIEKKSTKVSDSQDGEGGYEKGIDENAEELQENLRWIENNCKPWTKVQTLWKNTSRIRLRTLSQTCEPLHEYTAQYPALREPNGFTLLELDFDSLYPESLMKLYSEKSTLLGFIESMLSKKNFAHLFHELGKDAKAIKLLLNLNRLFPVVTNIKKKGAGHWRPSREESKEAFLLHIKTIGDLQPMLENRREKLAKFGLNLPPQAVIVGLTEESIQQSFVVIDNLRYEVETPFKAVDITFKVFHALHATYPPEAEQIWHFVQIAVYNIKTKCDKSYCAVNSLVNDYNTYKAIC